MTLSGILELCAFKQFFDRADVDIPKLSLNTSH